MVITAQLEESEGSADRPREHRRTLWLEAHGDFGSGQVAKVTIHNISVTGMLLESPVALAVDEKFAIELPQSGPNTAKVIWASGNLFGCQFETPISSATLSAAQLRSAVEPQTEGPARRDAVPDGTFARRLQRLRGERGLSQAQIAAQLGVSKPTVWAWEHGKARPIGERIEALAETLGVTPAELLSDAGASALNAMIAQSREQIAALVGTAPEKVRIWVEL